ncbi:ABC transporter substrate-binding protein [Ideonella livida]|uniref:ABC transporter substrate-binding protein n=1 Tax=Ideonella livida TaxID=2707176 RepID=A0A7C9TKJ8_9BURK|nr:ABC transporter substrate-binding protein [Ideonella livida]NDY91804.1 ABC transporter substrate-binding protein [Ideonella livida]
MSDAPPETPPWGATPAAKPGPERGAPRRQVLGALTVPWLTSPWLIAPIGQPARAANPPLLRLGVVVDQTGIGRVNGADLLAGSRALVQRVNREGGVLGARLELLVADDAFDPTQTRAHTQAMVQDPALMALLHPLGTRPTQAMAEAAPGVPIIGPSTGTVALRQAGWDQVFWTRASYAREVDRLLHTARTLSLRRMALVHPQDALGDALRQAFHQACERHGLSAVAVATTPGTESPLVAPAAQALAAAQPQGVLVGLAGTAPAFVHAYRALDRGASLYGLSIGASAGSLQALGPWARGMGFSVVVPPPTAAKFGLVRRYQADLLAAGSSAFSLFGVEGYLAASVAVQALLRAGPAPSRAGVLQALQGLTDLDLGGLPIRFGRDQREGSDYVSVAVVMADGRLAL